MFSKAQERKKNKRPFSVHSTEFLVSFLLSSTPLERGSTVNADDVRG
jgi:hypothetical protein